MDLLAGYGSDSGSEGTSPAAARAGPPAAPVAPAAAPAAAANGDAGQGAGGGLFSSLPQPTVLTGAKRRRAVAFKPRIDTAALAASSDSDSDGPPVASRAAGSSLFDALPQPKKGSRTTHDFGRPGGGGGGGGGGADGGGRGDGGGVGPTSAGATGPSQPHAEACHASDAYRVASAHPSDAFRVAPGPHAPGLRGATVTAAGPPPLPPAAAAGATLDYDAYAALAASGSAGPGPGSGGDALLQAELAAERARLAKAGGRLDAAAFKAVSQADLTYVAPHVREAMAANAARATAGAAAEARLRAEGEGVGRMAKRKHQITSLFHQAKLQEAQFTDARAAGVKSKAQTQAKYGW